MDSLLEGSEHLERELTPEPIIAPASVSFVLHGALFGALVFYGVLAGFFHKNTWGNAGPGGAIQVNLVSNAVPLPSENPPSQNVLATETPSKAPAPPAPKAKEAADPTAIAMPGKTQQTQQQPTQPKTQLHQPQQKPDNKAAFGEQAVTSMQRATQAQVTQSGPTSVSTGDFGSRFPWYVDGINRKMSTSWYKPEVDPRTPKGTRVYLTFTIYRDGSPSSVQVDRASGSPTLDRSCVHGVQRVDTFGQLPPGYTSSSLKVSYYCEY